MSLCVNPDTQAENLLGSARHVGRLLQIVGAVWFCASVQSMWARVRNISLTTVVLLPQFQERQSRYPLLWLRGSRNLMND